MRSMGVNLTIHEKEFVAIIGASGSGKSTLMNMIGCLDTPTSGQYYLDGEDISSFSDRHLAKIRNKKIGFIFQQFNLFRKMTAQENVERPLKYGKISREQRRKMTQDALEKVGLTDRSKHKPTELSGGQQQRVAIARALAGNPPVLLADEPTGNLDSKSSKEIMRLIKDLHDAGNTIVLITHDDSLANPGRQGTAHEGRQVRLTFVEGSTSMKILESIASAAGAVWTHKLRSFLTMLGIIIGIFAVTALISVGQSSNAAVTEQIEGLGTNLITISVRDNRADLDLDDVDGISKLAGVGAVSPTVTSTYTLKNGSTSMEDIQIQGVMPDYITIRDYGLTSGRFISDRDNDSRLKVAVIGQDIAVELFGSLDVVGQEISINGIRYEIIGLLEAQGVEMKRPTRMKSL